MKLTAEQIREQATQALDSITCNDIEPADTYAARNFLEYTVPTLLDHIAQLEAEVAALKEAERWIPVEERMPTENLDKEYFLKLKGGHAVGQFDGRRWFRYCTRGVECPIEKSYYHSVTHWRPLPKPPEAKGE